LKDIFFLLTSSIDWASIAKY